jgi:hypothetical protein
MSQDKRRFGVGFGRLVQPFYGGHYLACLAALYSVAGQNEFPVEAQQSWMILDKQLGPQTRSWGGNYYQLSYTHQGRGRTEYVPPDKVREVKRQTANYRKFRELTQEWVTFAIELCKIKNEQQHKE